MLPVASIATGFQMIIARGWPAFFQNLRGVLNTIVRVRGEILWVLAGQALSFSGGVVGIKLLTNLMGPENYGQLALGMTIAGLPNLFVYGPIANGLLRFYPVYRDKGTLPHLFCALRKIFTVATTCLLALIVLAMILLRPWVASEWGWIVITAGAFGIASGLNASLTALLNALRARRLVAIHQGADAWLRILLATAVILSFGGASHGVLIGYLVGALLVGLSETIAVLRVQEVQLNWNVTPPEMRHVQESVRTLYNYASPFATWAGIAAVGMYADRWILQGLLGPAGVGIYVALYQIARAPIVILTTTINQFLMPIVFNRAGAMQSNTQVDRSTRLLHQAIVILSLLILAITLVTYYWSEALVALFTTGAFTEHHKLLWVIVVSVAFYEVGQTCSAVGHTYMRTRPYILPFVVNGIVSSGLSYYLGRLHGIDGVAWAVCVANFLYFILVIKTNRQVITEMRLVLSKGELLRP